MGAADLRSPMTCASSLAHGRKHGKAETIRVRVYCRCHDLRRTGCKAMSDGVNSNVADTPQGPPQKRILDLSIWAPLIRRLDRGWIRQVSTVAKPSSR